MTGEHACAKPPVGSGGQPGADSGGMSQGPILREVTLPSGELGVTLVNVEPGSTKIKELHEGSPLLGRVQPGERISSYIGLSADGSTWTVSGTSKDSGADSTLHVVGSSVSYDYAMLVNENINVGAHCDRLPASASERMSIQFTNLTVNGRQAPAWTTRANCAGNALCDCGNAASVGADGDVTLSWRASWGGPCACDARVAYANCGAAPPRPCDLDP